MTIAEYKQIGIRRKAVLSFTITVVDLLMEVAIVRFKVDRTSCSFINFFIFWPLYLVALSLSILVVEYYIRNFRSLGVKYLLLTLPAFLFGLYFMIIILRAWFK